MKKIVFILIIIAVMFSFVGCKKEMTAEDIQYIEIRKGSLKEVYNVDEQIDFSNVFIVIVLKDKKGELVQRVDASMLEGFDTSTTTFETERRIMRVKYKGIYTSEWYYRVTSSYNVNTKARIRMEQQTIDNKLKVKLTLDLDTLPEIYGVQMSVNFDNSKLAYHGAQPIKEGWKLERRNVRAGSFVFLFYAEKASQSVTTNSQLLEFTFDIVATGSFNIELKDIVLSDGESDIYLPDASLK